MTNLWGQILVIRLPALTRLTWFIRKFALANLCAIADIEFWPNVSWPFCSQPCSVSVYKCRFCNLLGRRSTLWFMGVTLFVVYQSSHPTPKVPRIMDGPAALTLFQHSWCSHEAFQRLAHLLVFRQYVYTWKSCWMFRCAGKSERKPLRRIVSSSRCSPKEKIVTFLCPYGLVLYSNVQDKRKQVVWVASSSEAALV